MCERKAWTKEEDQLLTQLMGELGGATGGGRPKWNDIAAKISELGGGRLRKGKQCRERWFNQLHPAINREAEWTPAEETELFRLQALHGNRWARIARALPGRSDNNIKNYFYSTLRKALRRVNNYVTSHKHRTPYRNVKAFQANTLNKILTVAENKADRKVILGKQNAVQLAKDLREALIHLQMTGEEPSGLEVDAGMDELVAKIQDFNRVCKRRKSKKKDESDSENQQEDSLSGEQETSRNQSLAPTHHKSHGFNSTSSHRPSDLQGVAAPDKKPLHGRQIAGEERLGLGIQQVESEPLAQTKSVRQPIIPSLSSSNCLVVPSQNISQCLERNKESQCLQQDSQCLQQEPLIRKQSSTTTNLSFIPFIHQHYMGGSAFMPTSFFPRAALGFDPQRGQLDLGLNWGLGHEYKMERNPFESGALQGGDNKQDRQQ